jgi:osmoprotectant transport system permease protein
MDGRVAAAWRVLPEYLGAHVLLSASALALAVLVATPLAVASRRNRALRAAALGSAGLIQTIPGLALLALFFPVLLALSALSAQTLGVSFSALGFLPALLALTLYGVLPILRNGIAGLETVEAAEKEAARTLGASRGQVLLRVEAPQAAPIYMGGVRTAAVWIVGTATLATPVGQASLGNYIFTGLQTENWVDVLFGCVAAAALALVVDALLSLVESGARRGDGRRIAAGFAALLLGTAATASPLLRSEAPAYVIGAKNFSEQFILAELMSDRLRTAGALVERRDGLGSAVAFRALAGGELDVYVDYSGTLWTTVLGRTDTPPRAELNAVLARELQARHGVRVLGPLGFENAYALAIRRADAERLKVRSLADLARVAPTLTIGGDIEFFARPEWAAVEQAYGLSFRARRSYQPTFMYRALQSGEVDVISAFSSDGRIAADDLVLLEDPKGAIPPYDALVLLAPDRADDRRLVRALDPLIGSITIAAMQRANLAVDGEGKSPAEAATPLRAPTP